MVPNTKLARSLRTYLRGLSSRRSTGVVTADDANTFLMRNGVGQRSVRARLSYINSVLRTPEFEVQGFAPSARPTAKGRAIAEWVSTS